MSIVGFGIRYVCVEKSLHPQGAEDRIVAILLVTPELVFIPREEFGMAD